VRQKKVQAAKPQIESPMMSATRRAKNLKPNEECCVLLSECYPLLSCHWMQPVFVCDPLCVVLSPRNLLPWLEQCEYKKVHVIKKGSQSGGVRGVSWRGRHQIVYLVSAQGCETPGWQN
jgi:hypothetical protein